MGKGIFANKKFMNMVMAVGEGRKELWVTRKMFILIFASFLILTACGALEIATEGHSLSSVRSKETRFPKRVLIRFEAESGRDRYRTSRSVELIKDRATELFTAGLVQMGFDIVDPKTVYDEIKIEDINYAIFWATHQVNVEEIRERAKKIRQSLVDKFAIEGIFEGSIKVYYEKKGPGLISSPQYGDPPDSLEEMGGKNWDTTLRMSLTLIPSGQELWVCGSSIPYFLATTWEKSIERTTKDALDRLKRDIKR